MALAMDALSVRRAGRQALIIIGMGLLGVTVVDGLVEALPALRHGQRGQALAAGLVALFASLLLAKLWQRWQWSRDLDPVDRSPRWIVVMPLPVWLIVRPLMWLLSLLWGLLVLAAGLMILGALWLVQQIPVRRPPPLPSNVVDMRRRR
jgi:hypothetical protein